MECYMVCFFSHDPDDLTVYDSIDFGTDKESAYSYCISRDWVSDGMILDVVSYYDFSLEV